MKKFLLVLLILGMMVNPVLGADINDFKRGDDSEVIKGAESISDIDTLLEAYLSDPLARLLGSSIAGVELTWTDANTITVEIGRVACKSAGGVLRFRENTSTFTIDLSTSSDTSGVDKVGDVDKASSWFHIYANADADATTFTGCASLSASAPDGPTYFRYIGSVYNDAGQDMLAWFWTGRGSYAVVEWDIPIVITTTISAGAWSGATSCALGMPSTSEKALFGLYVGDTTAQSASIAVIPNGGDETAPSAPNEISVNTASAAGHISGQFFSATDSSQQIKYYNGAGDEVTSVNVDAFILER